VVCAEHRGEFPLEAYGHIAESDGAVASLQKRARDDSDRVGEIDDPSIRFRMAADDFRNFEYDRHGAQGLGQTARSRRFLAYAADFVGKRFVSVARSLAAHAKLKKNDIGVFDSLSDALCCADFSCMSGLGEHTA
jgi:hypothetical protein